jgi:branched-chain amino acid transport system substrate-binding protein
MGSETSQTRRDLLKLVGAGIGGLAVGSAVGSLAFRPTTERVVTATQVITQTVTAGAKSEPIKVGSLHGLTGWDAAQAKEMHRGSEMAVNEINQLGGVLGRPIEWIEVDTRDYELEQVLSAAETLISKHRVDYVIYGYSYVEAPLYDKLADAGILFLHTETIRNFAIWVRNNPDKGWLGFQPDPIETFYGMGFTVFLDSLEKTGVWKPRNRKVAIIKSEDSYGQTIAETFREEITKRGWTITMDDLAPLGTVEWGSFLAKIRADPPDVIFNTNWSTPDIVAFVKQFHERPVNSLLYGQWAPSTPEFRELAGDLANDMVWSTLIGYLPEDDPIAGPWKRRYRQLYGEEPGHQAAVNYDMFWLWATAVALAGDPYNKRKVANMLERLAYRGVCGTYRFNEEHWVPPYPDLVNDPSLGIPHHIYQIRELQDVLISPPPYAKAAFKLPWWFK